MADPLPKPKSQRRRRNADPSSAKLPPAGGSSPPPLPPGVEFTERTRVWWDAIWRSPMSVIWLESDVQTLYRLADLMEDAHLGRATAAVLSEIRQLEDRFGLSPLARRRLAWEVEQATGSVDASERDARGEDDRWLRVVSG